MEHEHMADFVGQIPIDLQSPSFAKREERKTKKNIRGSRRVVTTKKKEGSYLLRLVVTACLASIRFVLPLLPISLIMVCFTALYLGLDTKSIVLLNAFIFGVTFAIGCSFFHWILNKIFQKIESHAGKIIIVFSSFFLHLIGYMLISNYLFSLPMGYILEWQEIATSATNNFPAATVNLVIVMAISRWLYVTLRFGGPASHSCAIPGTRDTPSIQSAGLPSRRERPARHSCQSA